MLSSLFVQQASFNHISKIVEILRSVIYCNTLETRVFFLFFFLLSNTHNDCLCPVSYSCRCFFIAQSYVVVKKWSEALVLYERVLKYAREVQSKAKNLNNSLKVLQLHTVLISVFEARYKTDGIMHSRSHLRIKRRTWSHFYFCRKKAPRTSMYICEAVTQGLRQAMRSVLCCFASLSRHIR